MTEFKKQFLLSYYHINDNSMKMQKMKINDFHLYYHVGLKFAEVKTKTAHFILLGNLFSYSKPALLNNQILSQISKVKSKEELFDVINPFYGEYVLIADLNDEIIVFNDPCAQNEIYYNEEFTCFASQVKLMQKVLDIELSKDNELKSYYNSTEFSKKNISS